MRIFCPADILIPPEEKLPKWSVVACDQYTSQPEYWQETAAIVGESPSCLHMILPECFLAEAEARIPRIHAEMAKYTTDGSLQQRVTDGFVLAERSTGLGQRLGLICAADLEQYDFTGGKSLIRPTEQTITARLPARLAIRRNASIELSHVMLLMDDPLQSVIEPLYAKRSKLPMLYDFPLMQGGGHLRGWAVTGEEDKAAVLHALSALKSALGPEPLLFAVGDGNHSLAAAKVRWEELKPTLSPEEQAHHPARFAMVEVENIHDDALQFEPIHRLVTGVSGQSLMADWTLYCHQRGMDLSESAGTSSDEQVLAVVCAGFEITAVIAHPEGPLPVSTLQSYLDDFLRRHPEAQIDYIHGEDVLRQLASAPDAVGFLLPPLEKSALFQTIQSLGILPRKTFSMGHACEKRFYMECRPLR